MTVNNINALFQTSNEVSKMTTTNQRTTQFSTILEFAERGYDETKDDVSDAKIITENFKNEILSKLDTSKSTKALNAIKRRLGKLIQIAQELNGVQKNNLKPQGTPAQNNLYYIRLQDLKNNMKLNAEFIGSGLSVVQDSKTGLYKLCINNQLFDIPERKVEIVNENTEDGIELVPGIVD